ncbi:hypothetical protein GCM10009562_08950 [Nocardioides aquaticus]
MRAGPDPGDLDHLHPAQRSGPAPQRVLLLPLLLLRHARILARVVDTGGVTVLGAAKSPVGRGPPNTSGSAKADMFETCPSSPGPG